MQNNPSININKQSFVHKMIQKYKDQHTVVTSNNRKIKNNMHNDKYQQRQSHSCESYSEILGRNKYMSIDNIRMKFKKIMQSRQTKTVELSKAMSTNTHDKLSQKRKSLKVSLNKDQILRSQIKNRQTIEKQRKDISHGHGLNRRIIQQASFDEGILYNYALKQDQQPHTYNQKPYILISSQKIKKLSAKQIQKLIKIEKQIKRRQNNKAKELQVEEYRNLFRTSESLLFQNAKNNHLSTRYKKDRQYTELKDQILAECNEQIPQHNKFLSKYCFKSPLHQKSIHKMNKSTLKNSFHVPSRQHQSTDYKFFNKTNSMTIIDLDVPKMRKQLFNKRIWQKQDLEFDHEKLQPWKKQEDNMSSDIFI